MFEPDLLLALQASYMWEVSVLHCIHGFMRGNIREILYCVLKIPINSERWRELLDILWNHFDGLVFIGMKDLILEEIMSRIFNRVALLFIESTRSGSLKADLRTQTHIHPMN